MERLKSSRLLRESSAPRRMLGGFVSKAHRMLGHIASCLGKPALATVPISAVMLSRLETVGAQQSLQDAAHLFVGGRSHEGVPVIEDGATVGVVTRDDLRSVSSARVRPVGSPRRHATTW